MQHGKQAFSRQNSQVFASIAILLAILFYRMPGRFISGYLWAEDATTFIADFAEFGWHSLLVPYAGYLHILPRLATGVVLTIFPLENVPYVLPLVCTFIYTIAVGFAAVAFSRFEGARSWIVVLAALSPFIVPHGGEVFLTVTNLQWVVSPFFALLLWDTFLLSRPTRFDAKVAVRLIVIAILSLTGPFSVFLAPLCVLAFFLTFKSRPKSWPAAFSLLILIIAALIQLTLMRAGSSGPGLNKDTLTQIPLEALKHVVAEFYFPQVVLGTTVNCIVLAIVVLAGASYAIARSRFRLAAGVFVTFGILIWIAAVIRLNDSSVHYSWFGGGTRYLYIPAVMEAWALLLALSAERGAARIVAAALLLGMVGTSLQVFAIPLNSPWTITHLDDKTVIVVPPTPEWRVILPSTLP